MFKQATLSLLIIVSLAFIADITHTQSSLPIDAQLERLQRATVFIYQLEENRDNFFIRCVASGTLVSRDGLILTNAHSTSPNAECLGDVLVIALSVRLDAPPVPLYQAEIAQVDEGLDIALLRITRDSDGRLLDTSELSLPFVELGDSEFVQLDDTLTFIGYPALNDEPIQVLRGTVSAFLAEPSDGESSWLKTSSSVPGLMSGGGAYDQNGRLVAIPTGAPPALADDTNCLNLEDTNGDGIVNTVDNCVPIPGDVNTLRPANFARSLLRAASLDLAVENLTDSISSEARPFSAEQPEIERLFFTTAVSDAGLPGAIVGSAPTGITSLYLFFDYTNMTPETVYEVRVTTDNIPNPIFSLAPVRWSGDSNGLWYIGSSGQIWRNGVYTFTIFVDGIAKATASIVIGGAPDNAPTIGDIVFGLSDQDGTPLGNGFVLPVGNIASARFIYRNMPDGISWLARWFYEGNEVFRTPPDTWRDGENGAKTISIQDPSGQLLAGRYRLEIYLDGRLAATSDFTIAGLAEGAFPEIFDNVHFATANSAQEALTAPANSNFITNITTLYLLFDWQQIARGTVWTAQWSVDNTPFYERRARWLGSPSGSDYLFQLESPDGIPDGTYRLNLYVNEVLLASVEAVVGIGQLPIDQFAQPTGVQLQGYILNTDTGQGISGVTFVMISEDFSVADFVWDAEQVYAMATTDRNGFFQFERLLEISTDEATVPYSIVISADGYLPIEQDGFVVDEETDNPLTLTIYLLKE